MLHSVESGKIFVVGSEVVPNNYLCELHEENFRKLGFRPKEKFILEDMVALYGHKIEGVFVYLSQNGKHFSCNILHCNLWRS